MTAAVELRWAVGFVVLPDAELDRAELEVRMSKRGSVSVKVDYSPWLRAEGGCLRKQGEFTRLTVNESGVYRISSEYLAAVDSAEPSSPRLR
nr:hypothetical protein [Streptomyces sp. NRRL S-646]